MSTRTRGLVGAALLAAALAAPVGCERAAREEAEEASAPAVPRHLVLLTVDTLRADALGAYGRSKAMTASIDALAARGTRFDSAMTPMTRTTPALASILTGLSPRRHGSQEVGEPLGGGTTLAEHLERAGFATLAVSASAVADPAQHLDRGVERFVTIAELRERYAGRLYHHGLPAPPTGVALARAATLEAIALLEEVPADRRVFLWVHYMDPHVPYRPPSPWNETIPAPRCRELYRRYAVEQPQLSWRVFTNFEGIAEAAADDCRALYQGDIAAVDAAIGELEAALAESGRLDDTLVVLTADHGESFGEGDSWFEHGEHTHRSELRVPLVLAGPGIAAGEAVRGLVSLEDLLPTVLARLGVEAPAGRLDGVALCGGPGERCAARPDALPVLAESGNVMRHPRSTSILSGNQALLSCIHGERFVLCDHRAGEPLEPPRLHDALADPGLTVDVAAEHPEAVAELRRARARWPIGSARKRAALSGRFKLVETPRLAGGYDVALFDTQADPEERRDVKDEHPEVVTRLSAALAERDRAHPLAAGAGADIDERTHEALKQLMYVD